MTNTEFSYPVGQRVRCSGRPGTVEAEDRPHWYCVRMEDTQEVEVQSGGCLEPVPVEKPPMVAEEEHHDEG